MKTLSVLFISGAITLSVVVKSYAFTFDIWDSGISYDEAYRIAEAKGIMLRSSAYNSAPQKKLLSRDYDDYLMGKSVKVVLFFTPKSDVSPKWWTLG